VPVPEAGCWLWFGTDAGKGYGQFMAGGKVVKAHRFSWEIHNGPIPSGASVCHRCDTPQCVNPAHLFIGTNADNCRDRAVKGRAHRPRGGLNPMARLTSEQVALIRQDKRKRKVVANEYGVGPSCISKIRANQTWVTK